MKVGNKTFPLGQAWLSSPDRREYDSVVLDPGEPEVTKTGCLNLWRGFGVTAKQGDWRRIQGHIFNVLANGDQKVYEYILRWTAWSIQNPGNLPEVALVFRGGKGAGKGVFAKAVVHLFGSHGMQIFNQKHFTGNFNGHLRFCLMLHVDEAFWAGDKKGESVLKGLITEDVLIIEQKGIDATQWKNRLHIIMTANADWVVPASADERRFVVVAVSDQYAQNGLVSAEERQKYFRALHEEMNLGGLEAMLYDLKSIDLKGWHPREVYETEALLKQKQLSMTMEEQWFDEVLQEGVLPGMRMPDKPRSPSTRTLVQDEMDRVPASRNYISHKRMGDFLRKLGCSPTRTAQERGWMFPPLAEMRRKWERKFGPRDWGPEQDWQ